MYAKRASPLGDPSLTPPVVQRTHLDGTWITSLYRPTGFLLDTSLGRCRFSRLKSAACFRCRLSANSAAFRAAAPTFPVPSTRERSNSSNVGPLRSNSWGGGGCVCQGCWRCQKSKETKQTYAGLQKSAAQYAEAALCHKLWYVLTSCSASNTVREPVTIGSCLNCMGVDEEVTFRSLSSSSTLLASIACTKENRYINR